MKIALLNLLPGKVKERVAQNFVLSKIESKFLSFRRLTIIFLIVFLSGYHPQLTFPLIRSSKAYASQDIPQVQKAEIVASSFPQPISLPHPGYLSTPFSKWHKGIDIASGLGMPVHPITGGEVIEVNFSFWGYGNHIVMIHPNDFKSIYGHLGRIFAKIGQKVEAETILGEVGMSGWTSGPHTHLEITYHGNHIDPLTILPEISDEPNKEFISRK